MKRWAWLPIIVLAVSAVALVRHRGELAFLAAPSRCPAEPPAPSARPAGPPPGGGFTSLAATANETCAQAKDSEVWCWGVAAGWDRAGRGPLALRLATLPSVPAFVAGSNRAGAAALASGELYAWDDAGPVRRVDGPADVATIDEAAGLTCGRTTAGTVFCLEHGTRVPLDELGHAVEVVVSHGQVCARAGDGKVSCLDLDETPSGAALPKPRPEPRRFPLESTALAALLGDVCSLEKDKTLDCWSSRHSELRGPNGPLATGSVSTLRGAPGRVCAVLNGDTLACFAGKLGEPPVLREGFGSIRDVGVTEHGTCVLSESGTVTCFGSQLPSTWSVGPAAAAGGTLRVAGLSAVSRLSMNDEHVCAARAEGWSCWETAAEAAAAPAFAGAYPTLVAREPPYVAWVAGGLGRCGVSAEHVLSCTGSPDAFAHAPRAEARWFELDHTTSASVGDDHGCAIRDDRSLWCWGASESGELGAAAKSAWTDAPVAVARDVVETAVGLRHTCAVATSGAVECWGDDGFGQLGGAPAPNGPVEPALPAQAVRLSAGWFHTCALLADGSVYCWGDARAVTNAPPAEPSAAPPTRIPLPGPARALAAGPRATCALSSDRTVSCWGRLFECSAEDREHGCRAGEPLETLAASGKVTSIAVGAHHVCALLESGAVECAGQNSRRELGAELGFDRVVHDSHHAETCSEVTYRPRAVSSSFVRVAF